MKITGKPIYGDYGHWGIMTISIVDRWTWVPKEFQWLTESSEATRPIRKSLLQALATESKEMAWR